MILGVVFGERDKKLVVRRSDISIGAKVIDDLKTSWEQIFWPNSEQHGAKGKLLSLQAHNEASKH